MVPRARPTISQALWSLVRLGLVTNDSFAALRAFVSGFLADRKAEPSAVVLGDDVGLENAACECYEAVATEYRALFGEYPLNLAPAV
jgi:DNA-binding transcriptional regulator YbjK